MREILVFIAMMLAFCIGATVLIGVIVVPMVYYLERSACFAQWSKQFEPQFGFFPGCTIIIKGERIPTSHYRVVLQ